MSPQHMGQERTSYGQNPQSAQGYGDMAGMGGRSHSEDYYQQLETQGYNNGSGYDNNYNR
jgi:hypothetical protein